MQEMDLLLGRFAERFVTGLDDGQLDRFEALLEENDLDLLDWITGRRPLPEAFDHDVMKLLLDFRNSAIKS